MAKTKAISRTNKKVIIHLEQAAHYLSDVEMELLTGMIKRLENIEYFIEQQKGK